MSGNYNRKDSYYEKAKAEGHRSRAYYKLEDLNKKFKFLKPGVKVLDLGAWPGGWTECASKIVTDRGLVTAIDLVKVDEFPDGNIHIIEGDAREDSVIQSALNIAEGQYDVLISDMSPKLSGIKEADRWASVGLLELALWSAGQLLKPGGDFIAKAFKSNESEEFYRQARPSFTKLTREELKSSRKTSTEFYIVGLGFKHDSLRSN